MSAEPRFLGASPLDLLREKFNRFARGLPSEFNIAAVQLQADISYQTMFEHIQKLQEKKRPYTGVSLEIYNEAINDYTQLINVGIDIIAHYETLLDKTKLDETAETYIRYLNITANYFKEIIKPNYERLQRLPQKMLASLLQQATRSQETASRLETTTDLHNREDYIQACTHAIEAYNNLLICLKNIAETINSSDQPDKKKLQQVIQLHQNASENLTILEWNLKRYEGSPETTEAPEFGLEDNPSESSSQGFSSDSQEEALSDSPDYAADSPPKPHGDTKIMKSNGGSSVFFPALNENKRPNDQNSQMAVERINPPRR